MLKHLITATSRVEYILEKCPVTRDDDKLLWLTYLAVHHNLQNIIGTDAFNKFKTILMQKDTCSMESVRRTRQKFQEKGKYVGTKRQVKLEEAEAVQEFIRN